MFGLSFSLRQTNKREDTRYKCQSAGEGLLLVSLIQLFWLQTFSPVAFPQWVLQEKKPSFMWIFEAFRLCISVRRSVWQTVRFLPNKTCEIHFGTQLWKCA